jgi:phenylalanyl-tRNA synthetase beta chain
MPVVPVPLAELNGLGGLSLRMEEALDLLPQLGGDVDRVEGETIHIEYFPDRSDLVSVEGVARALAAFVGKSPGLRTYPMGAAVAELEVDAAVAPVRPWILACGVSGLPALDDESLVALMEFQERLANGVGRRRRRVAIGIHDARGIRPPYRYTVADAGTRFHPLQGDREMSVREILDEHPKGRAWRHLLPEKGPFPIILDRDGHVLSLPPVINGTRTELRVGTTDLVLDLTGPDLSTLETAMAILATALADRGARIEPFAVRYPRHEAYGAQAGRGLVTPDLAPRSGSLRLSETKRILGLDLTSEAVAHRLARLGHAAHGADGDRLEVASPRWRGDLLHEWDLIEDVAKGHGYAEVPDAQSRVPTVGAPHPTATRARIVRSVMTGLGFLEATTLTLVGPVESYDHFDVPRPSDARPVAVTNPITTQHTELRTWLTPGLFALLAQNRHRDYPQSLYEAGIVVDPATHRNAWRLAAVHAHAKANYSEVKGIVEATLRDLAVAARAELDDHPAFVPGRVARFLAADGTVLGRAGEYHPRVLMRFELAVPVVGMEFDLDSLFA